jgi:hypothetical protein
MSQVAAVEPDRRVRRRRVVAVWREEIEGAVRPVLVVMRAVNAEHVFEIMTAEDEDAVEAVGADGTHPALGEGVRVRRLHRCLDDLDA